MKILYIDTSSSYLYVGIVENNNLVCEVQKEFGHNLSEEALPEIEKMFTQFNILPNEISKIIVVNGPGSFTGIRIGITISKVYAWSLNIPITTISSLEAMSISSDVKTLKVPMIDARRGYVYSAIYTENNETILKPQHIKIDEVIQTIDGKDFTLISNDELNINCKTKRYVPNILKIVNTFKDKDSINPHAVNPEYLKLTEAEESKLI